MVNTFLIDTDFRKSAAKLDNRRLGKQRVEAKQILIALQQLRYLARYFNLPDFPIDEDRPKEERQNWIQQVLAKFKESGFGAIHIRSKFAILIPKGQEMPIRPNKENRLMIDEKGIVYEIKGKNEKVVNADYWWKYVLPGEELITTGFRRHPAVCMWLGFETALKDYINAHIEEWIRRGYNNNMELYSVPENYPRPSWSTSKDVIDNFKSTLVDRELRRNEPLWYSKQKDMVLAFAINSVGFDQFQNIINSLPSLIPKLNHKNQLVYKQGKIVLTEPPCYLEIKNQLLHMGSFPGFIWP